MFVNILYFQGSGLKILQDVGYQKWVHHITTSSNPVRNVYLVT